MLIYTNTQTQNKGALEADGGSLQWRGDRPSLSTWYNDTHTGREGGGEGGGENDVRNKEKESEDLPADTTRRKEIQMGGKEVGALSYKVEMI